MISESDLGREAYNISAVLWAKDRQCHAGSVRKRRIFGLTADWMDNGRLLDASTGPSKTPDFALFCGQQSRTTIYEQKRYLS